MVHISAVLQLLEQGALKPALDQCLVLIQQNPEDADAQHLLGLLYAKTGEIYKAIDHFKKAINLDPRQATYHNNISNAYKIIGDADLAMRHLHTSLQLDPNHAESFNNLGSLYYTKGAIKDAQLYFEKAIRLNPASYEAHYNLANCYIKQDMVLQAITHYQAVLRLNATHSHARLNLAMSYVLVHDYTQALPLLEEAVQNDPQNAELQGHLAEAFLNLGNTEAALEQYKRAIALDPDRPAWQHNLGVLYLRAKQTDLAKQHLQIAVQLQPDNSTAQHMLAALESKQDIKNAPAEYVKLLFDQYAGYYNQHMQKELQYNVPQFMRQAINKFVTEHTTQQYILDLGCGTGLCGIYFRDLARFAVGVDISPAMLVEAKNLGAYDALCCCNILETIPGMQQEYFDIILAADVLVYIGELERMFEIVVSALKPSALFAFTIEVQDQNTSFILQPSGRFAHALNYIRNLAAMYNLQIEISESIIPRRQEGQPISGHLFVLRKTSAAYSIH